MTDDGFDIVSMESEVVSAFWRVFAAWPAKRAERERWLRELRSHTEGGVLMRSLTREYVSPRLLSVVAASDAATTDKEAVAGAVGRSWGTALVLSRMACLSSRPRRPRDFDPQAFAGRLRALRESRGWSQAELAGRASLSPGAVGDIESGRRRDPSARTLFRLANAIGITVEQLAGGPHE